MEKPGVDFIEGLSPEISIDQKGTSRNPRSTVGTITEIYDYLRVLFARVGHPHCTNCGRPIGRPTPEQSVNQVRELPEGTRFQVLGPIVGKEEVINLSQSLACTYCGLSFDELAPRNFSFNSPYGACQTCDGLGTRLEVDAELVVPDADLSINEGAIAPWASTSLEY